MSDADQVREPGAVAPAEPGPAARLAAHAQITRLADELLPALVARLAASGLGELEVREGSWRVRLRMPAGSRTGSVAARRGGRAGAGVAAGPGRHGPAGAETSAASTSAPDPAPSRGVAAGQPVSGGATDEALGRRLFATAPAVGFYQPRHGLVAGSRLRAGERLGIVDVLGVPQDVPAPDDGILGALLVEAGEPVEYGQDIAVIELLPAAVPAPGSAPASMPVGELVQAEVRP